jgi:hypothetical protein
MAELLQIQVWEERARNSQIVQGHQRHSRAREMTGKSSPSSRYAIAALSKVTKVFRPACGRCCIAEEIGSLWIERAHLPILLART